MADWNGLARSNHFRVKNEAAFREELEDFDVKIYESNNKEDKLFCLVSNTEHGDWPSYRYDDEEGEGEDIDMVDVLAPHLLDGEVCVLMEAGSEKERYVTGHAVAFNNTAERIEISLNMIYAIAQNKFGSAPTPAEY